MASRSQRFPLLALVLVVALLALPAVAAAQSDGAALAQERYYSSYGQTTATPAPAAAPSDGPGWTIVAVGGVALLLAGVAFGAVGSRATVRPRGASA
jgi:hypothetical protein